MNNATAQNVDAELLNRQQPQDEDDGGEQNNEASRADTFRREQQEARRGREDAPKPGQGRLRSGRQAINTATEAASTVKKVTRLWKILAALGALLFNPISGSIVLFFVLVLLAASYQGWFEGIL